MIRALPFWFFLCVLALGLKSDVNRSFVQAESLLRTIFENSETDNNIKQLGDLRSVSDSEALFLQIFHALQHNRHTVEYNLLLSGLSELSLKFKDSYWIDVSGELGNPDALYVKAMETSEPQHRAVLLNKAANLGHAQSQFEIAVNAPSEKKRDLLEASANQGYTPSIIALGKLYYEAGEIEPAIQWLSQSASVDALSAFKLAKIFWQAEDVNQSKALFKQAFELGYLPAKDYLNALQDFNVLELSQWQRSAFKSVDISMSKEHEAGFSSLVQNFYSTLANCEQKIEVLATSLESLVQANAFIERFKHDSRVVGLKICFNSPVWLTPDSLSCESGTRENDRLTCDLSALSNTKMVPKFSHLVIFEQEGKANVNNGIMYLDLADQYSVFVHELAHFAGFVDEYALPSQQAYYHCERLSAPNLIVLGEVTYSPVAKAQSWQNKLQALRGSSPEEENLGFARSNTCVQAKIRSFKPSQRMTFMEFHDVEYIPDIYVALWQEALKNQRMSLPVLTNMAISAYQNDNEEMALYWELIQSQMKKQLSEEQL